MKSIKLQPIALVDGIINLPGSKSISNRALLLSALACGTTVLTNLLDSDDTYYMLNALKTLGIQIVLSEDKTICTIIGNDGVFNTSGTKIELFLGNAGTVMRTLTAVLCLSHNNIILTGDQRMKERPIGYLVDALIQGNGQIKYLARNYYPPLQLFGGFSGGNIILNGNISSQFITALLIAAPLATKDTVIQIKGTLVSRPYVDITMNMMNTFGISIKHQSYQYFFIKGRQKYQSPGKYSIEGDASSASYFLAAAAIKGGTVKVTNVGRDSIQGDIYFADILNKMGAIATCGDNYITCTRGNILSAIDMDMNHVPDIAMTVAVMALFAKGTTVLRNIYNWRIKETDRLLAMATELRKVGAITEEYKDCICITPPVTLRYAQINTYNDHRIAMCFSLVALSNVPVTIINPICTMKTFPNYFQQLASISYNYNIMNTTRYNY